MIIDDTVAWVTVFTLGLFFTLEFLDFPLRTHNGPQVIAGVILAYIRVVVFPYLAATCWFVMAAFAATANNCSSVCGGCFTSPTYSATTSTIFPSSGGQIMYYIFLGMFASFLVIGIVLTIYFAFRPLQAQMEGPASSPV